MFDPHTLLLLAALAAPHDSSARVPSVNDSVLASVVSPLVKPGEHMRVRTVFGVAEGLAGTVAPVGVQLRREPAEGWSRPYGEPIAWTQIDRIELRTQSGRTGVVVGASIGALLGLAVMMSAASYASAYGHAPGGDVLLAGLVGGIGGGCVGGLAGALVGSMFPGWRTVYERR
jgi:hypothetical protein